MTATFSDNLGGPEPINSYRAGLQRLEQAGVQSVVLDPRLDSDWVDAMGSQAGWRLDFQDQEAVIFVKTGD